MSIIEAIAIIDIAWEEEVILFGVEPNINKGYFSFRNEVINSLKEKEIIN